MLEHELCSSRVLSPFREESGDEELSVLPRHTKVIVTGNNRTKSVLVGLQGVVKKAVGLGGWHWLVLKNGVEVKLQRNALSVLEHPTGNEVDDDHDFDNSSSGSDIGEKDRDFSSSIEFQRPAKPRVRHAKPWVSSASVKSTNRNGYRDVRSISHAPLSVNLARLDIDSLRRYCRHYKIGGVNAYSPREQMLNAVQQHFVSQPSLKETQVIPEFVSAAKRRKTDETQSEQQ
ncbi:Histone deacetylase complex subunit SAP30/SAP30-like protein [Corchorus capsularis]|uniref:Histone deacetylase complex subunit SAP30/SAP30-like protein n=1 Tax=Corchorus capsularis TaxID=210143 RepID=A0A1R3IAG2_COCAP|nr:Histone deacetylase complex subunit SAP30/SAP30-like protein [Corchorus capsularis]